VARDPEEEKGHLTSRNVYMANISGSAHMGTTADCVSRRTPCPG